MTRNKASSAAARKRPRLAIARALLFFFVFLCLEIVIDNRHELELETASCESVHADETPWLYEGIYPRLTSFLLKRGTSGKVRIVYIPEDLLEVQQNVCLGREYLAGIINVLRNQAAPPAAIVLDKYFSTQSCTHPEEKLQSAGLRKAVMDATEQGITVVAGEATGTPTDPVGGVCLSQNADWRFFTDLCSDHYGLTKLNANREQIPLTWRVLDRSSPKKVLLLDSLALTTARLVEPERIAETHLQDVLHQSRQPYARLDLSFPCVSSATLLPGFLEGSTSPATGTNETQQKETKNSDGNISERLGCDTAPGLLHDLAGKIVLIGSMSSSDRWLVMGKRHWGYQLQASYIDALLSSKYLSAVPGKWIIGLSVLFLFLLEAVPVVGDYLYCERNMQVALILRRAELWLVAWSVTFIVLILVTCFAWQYLPPLSLVLGVVLTIALRGLFFGMEYFGKQSTPDRKDKES